MILKQDTIRNCYRHVSFGDGPPQAASDNTTETEKPSADSADFLLWGIAQRTEIAGADVTFDDFEAIDDKVLTGAAAAGQTVDNLLDTVLPSNEAADEESSDEECVVQRVPKFREAMEGLETALFYLRSTKNSTSTVKLY